MPRRARRTDRSIHRCSTQGPRLGAESLEGAARNHQGTDLIIFLHGLKPMNRLTRPSPTQLRAAMDRGQTGDKVDWPDPAAAPLGTDEEAGSVKPVVASGSHGSAAPTGKPATPDESKKIEGPIPNIGLSRFNDEYGRWILVLGAGLLAATFLLLAVF